MYNIPTIRFHYISVIVEGCCDALEDQRMVLGQERP